MDEKLIKDIIKTRKTLRKKYDALKSGTLEKTTELERIFKPITAPLEKLTSNKTEQSNKTIDNLTSIKKGKSALIPTLYKHEKSKGGHNEQELFNTNDNTLQANAPKYHSTPIREKLNIPPAEVGTFDIDSQNELENNDFNDTSNAINNSNSITTADKDDDESSNDAGPHNIANNTLRATEKYITQYTKRIPAKNLDNKFGIYYSAADDRYKIGKLPVTIENNNRIIIDDIEYKLTPGLKELLFLKEPNISNIKVPDILSYKKIVKASSLLHRNYNENQQYAGSKSAKYKFIKKLFKSDKSLSGAGLMKYSKNKLDYIYWDDPNELVDRLRLLLASQKAGNTSHNNEIISIIEELKEKKYIK